jgi:hypothetical protein
MRRGDFASMDELVAAIHRFCDRWNQHCQPFRWTKDADQILATSGSTTTTRPGPTQWPDA